jgi:hypothetical protein
MRDKYVQDGDDSDNQPATKEGWFPDRIVHPRFLASVLRAEKESLMLVFVRRNFNGQSA